MVVEDPGDVCRERRVRARRDQRAGLTGEGQGRRAAAEHVDRAAPPHDLDAVADLGVPGHVVGDGDGVQVSREDDAVGQAQAGARAHGVAVAQDLQGGHGSESGGAQRGLDGVSQRAFLPRHRGNVDHLARQRERIREIRQLHVSSFIAASRIAVPSPICVPPHAPARGLRPRRFARVSATRRAVLPSAHDTLC